MKITTIQLAQAAYICITTDQRDASILMDKPTPVETLMWRMSELRKKQQRIESEIQFLDDAASQLINGML